MSQGRVVTVRGELAGLIWFVGWLFTIGFAQIVGWKILFALIVWPYYLGVAVR